MAHEIRTLLRFFIWNFFGPLSSFDFFLWFLASWLLGSCFP